MTSWLSSPSGYSDSKRDGIGGVGGLYEDEDELIQSLMYILVKECWVVLEASTVMPVLEVSYVMPVLKVLMDVRVVGKGAAGGVGWVADIGTGACGGVDNVAGA